MLLLSFFPAAVCLHSFLFPYCSQPPRLHPLFAQREKIRSSSSPCGAAKTAPPPSVAQRSDPISLYLAAAAVTNARPYILSLTRCASDEHSFPSPSREGVCFPDTTLIRSVSGQPRRCSRGAFFLCSAFSRVAAATCSAAAAAAASLIVVVVAIPSAIIFAPLSADECSLHPSESHFRSKFSHLLNFFFCVAHFFALDFCYSVPIFGLSFAIFTGVFFLPNK